jgi:hypothetical protein
MTNVLSIWIRLHRSNHWRRREFTLPRFVVSLILLPSFAMAHHSATEADMAPNVRMTLTGTVKKFEWQNPHVWIRMVVVRPDSTTEEWGFEMASPGSLVRFGLRYQSIATGDKITVEAAPMRDGRHAGIVTKIVLANGTTWIPQGTASALPPDQRTPEDLKKLQQQIKEQQQ